MFTLHSIKAKLFISLLIIFVCVLLFQFIFIIPWISQNKTNNSILKRTENEAWLISIFIISSLLISFIVILFIIHLSLRPLTRLIKRIKSGSKIDITGYPKDEIGVLTCEYNKLYTDLYTSIEKIKIEISL